MVRLIIIIPNIMIRVAEVVIAFTRSTLAKMQEVNKRLSFVVLYDDRNSLLSNVKNIEDVSSIIIVYSSNNRRIGQSA
jgi:hypothetical protein